MYFGPSLAQRPCEYRKYSSSAIAAGEHTHVFSLGRGNFKIIGIQARYANSSSMHGAIPIKVEWTHKVGDVTYWNQLGGGYLTERNYFGLGSQPEVEGPGTLRITILNADVTATLSTYVSYRRVD